MCAAGGFKLTKFISNRIEVLNAIPEEDRRTEVKDCDLLGGKLPVARSLGVLWNTESDIFGFKVVLENKPLTRRGMLSALSSIYDPLGFVAPFILKVKSIIQQLCKGSTDWDAPAPAPIEDEWLKWMKMLPALENIIKVRRCFKPDNFGKVIDCSLHYFSDACEFGYGQATYLRMVDDKGKIHCSLVMGKARVTPMKYVSIPRIELTAAVLSVKIAVMLRKELKLEQKIKEMFWTDSEVVLGYLKNDAKRFKVFVANRIQTIKNHTNINEWNYVSSKENPADDGSRGLNSTKSGKVKRWFEGP